MTKELFSKAHRWAPKELFSKFQRWAPKELFSKAQRWAPKELFSKSSLHLETIFEMFVIDSADSKKP